MIALRAHDDTEAELLRLRRDLLAFVVDEISRTAPPGRSHALAGQVADAITETAAAATRAELFHVSQNLATELYGALGPQLTERLPALVQSAVETALAEQAATSKSPSTQAFWALAAINGLALAVGLAALFLR